MNKRYEDYEYPFDEIDEIDEDGYTNYIDIEDLHNTEFMKTNSVYPPRGSYTHIPTSQFLVPGVDVDETIKAFNKLNEYNQED
jgi:hypothetical protein